MTREDCYNGIGVGQMIMHCVQQRINRVVRQATVAGLVISLGSLAPVFALDDRLPWDRNNDGQPDMWVLIRDRHVAGAQFDRNNDGQPDLLIEYENQRPVRLVLDADRDGHPEVWADTFAGQRPTVLIRDSSGAHRPDTWIFYDTSTGMKQSVERDINGDGQSDVWIQYAQGHMLRWQRDTDFDGTIDQRGGLPEPGTPSDKPMIQWQPEEGGEAGAAAAGSAG